MNVPLMLFVLFTYIATTCALVCCGLHRQVPLNYALLAIWTFCVSYIVASVAMRYDQILVIEAAFLTASVVVAITVYAFTTKTDFTVCGPLPMIFGCVFLTAALLALLFPGK